MTRRRHKKTQEKKKTRNRGQEITTHPDLSIRDFADAAEPKQMPKKMQKGFVKSYQKEYELLPRKHDDLLWYEKDDLDLDFNITSTGQESDYSTDEENFTTIEKTNDSQQNKSKRKTKENKLIESESFSGENVYPLDLWCLLSKFIRPEDVLRFSLICKGAFQAVTFFGFWIRLYNTFVSEPEKLPVKLQPSRIDCYPGLRARVVRALYHQYSELKDKLLMIVRDSPCLDDLVFQFCSSVWYRQMKTKKDTTLWMFYFKFSQNQSASNGKPKPFSKKWFNTVDVVRDNPDEGLTVLTVTCLNFISFQPVIGMVLTEALVGVSQSMKHSRVKLMFHTHRNDKRYRPECGYQVILDPVQDVRMLKWWHPLYPTC